MRIGVKREGCRNVRHTDQHEEPFGFRNTHDVSGPAEKDKKPTS